MEPFPDTDWSIERRTAWWAAKITELLGRHPIAEPRMAPWAAELLVGLGAMPIKSMAVRLRTAGEALTPDEKRRLELPVRLKIGSKFAADLTALGRKNITEAAEAIAAYPVRARGRSASRYVIELDRAPARLIVYDDDGTCAAARPLVGKHADWYRLPSFPLGACDKLLCRCSFDRYMPPKPEPALPRRRRRKPAGCATAVALLVLVAAAIALAK